MTLINDTSDAIRTLRLLDNFGIAALISNAEGVVQLLNNSAAAMFGQEPGWLEGQQLQEIKGFEALVEMLSAEDVQITPRTCQVLEHFYCLVRMQRIGRIGYVFTFDDVTEFKDREDQMNTALHMVAHDLKAPIASIKSYADLVKAAGTLSDKQDKFLERVQQAVRKMDGLVLDLLDLAWIDAGNPLDKEAVNIAHLTHNAITLLDNHARKRDITIELTIADGLPKTVGDARRLERVVVNILSNAIKFSPRGSKVHIAIKHDNDHVTVSITDHGNGIPGEYLPHIFKRFYRVPQEDDKTEGTGLGLSVAQSIVERHQGRLKVTSNVGQGSIFETVLPIIRPVET